MTSARHFYPLRERRQSRSAALLARHFGVACALIDLGIVVGLGAATGWGWHAWSHAAADGAGAYMRFSLLMAAAYLGIGLLTGIYEMRSWLSGRHGPAVVARNWLIAFLIVLSIGFLLKNMDEFSRGATMLLLAIGLGALLLRELWAGRVLSRARDDGRLDWRRVLLVGARHDISAFLGRFRPGQRGLSIVGKVEIDAPVGHGGTGGGGMGSDGPGGDGGIRWSPDKLKEAVTAARILSPDDVYLVTPWSQHEFIAAALGELAVVPAAIHLAPEHVLARFPEPRIGGLRGLPTLELCRPPLSRGARAFKRGFDMLAAAAGLVLLAPLLAIVAVLIKLDSPGPVLFRQIRYGYNQKPFRILKFRSMTVMENGPSLTAVARNDARVTRVGRWLRRTNIDELPQLVNVLKGHMSLVGPRPHAMAHDHAYMAQIIAYARRNNVKPGITGWAQVNGLRGGDDLAHIRKRVACDIWYLENWSPMLDIQIILRTLFSSRAYSNAF